MIHISAGISNPFSQRWKSHFAKSWAVTKNKSCEIEGYYDNSIIGFGLSITARTDHAGVRASLSFFGYTIEASFYDIRHWAEFTAGPTV